MVYSAIKYFNIFVALVLARAYSGGAMTNLLKPAPTGLKPVNSFRDDARQCCDLCGTHNKPQPPLEWELVERILDLVNAVTVTYSDPQNLHNEVTTLVLWCCPTPS